MAEVRAAAVAGSFYPADAGRLALEIERLFAAAGASAKALPKVLVVPHAGYAYSGAVAASAFAGLRGLAHRIERVVVLGPSHHVALSALALPGAALFATPLGEVAVDSAGVTVAAKLPQVVTAPAAHRREHSLEVQLPFLQTVLPGRPIVPLVVGQVEAPRVAEAIEALWGGPETLILASTDLSHFLSYEEAVRLDRATADQIVGLEPIASEQACGAVVLNGLLLAGRRRPMRVRELDLRNSGDTAGDRSRVVGYGAFALFEEACP